MNPKQWNHASLALVATSVAFLAGCIPAPQATRAAINDRFYAVTPDTMTVKTGVVSGQVTELKVSERVEEGSGRIDVPARLTAKLVLKNTSTDQTVRLLGGRIGYYDMQGKSIAMEDNRAEPLLRISAYGTSDRLDPGQDVTQNVEVEFPAEALKAKRLKDIRLELSYIPSPFKQESMSFPVSIGSPK